MSQTFSYQNSLNNNDFFFLKNTFSGPSKEAQSLVTKRNRLEYN